MLAAWIVLVPARAAAQGVLVAPHAIFMDHRSRSASLEVYNPGLDPAEITLDLIFGFPITDSAGTFELFTVDHPDSTYPSAASWILTFPRRLRLAPGQRQVVRLLGRPPADLADGEYWARLVVTATGSQIPVTGVADSGEVRVGLNLEVRTLLPIQYRKGQVTTGLTLGEELTVHAGRDSLTLHLPLTRTGSGAFLGTVRGSLVDSTGRIRSHAEAPLAVYRTLAPRFALPLEGVPSGRYRLILELASERQDLPPEAILPITPVRLEREVRIP